MLQLINRARANPPAEASRIVGLTTTDPVLKAATAGVDLTAFVQQASSVGSLPPLAFNTRLIAAARDHDATVLAANDQTHAPSGFLVTGAGGLIAGDGQVYYPVGQSSWATGENVFAYTQNVNGSSLKQYVDYLHEGLMIDWGNPDFGHLKNILEPGPGQAKAAGALPFSEIGIGLLSGNPTAAPATNPDNPANKGLNVGPVILTQEFAWKSGNAFLTGAVYRDADTDNFYTPGEGLGGVTVQAVGLHGEGTFATQTWGSGGYSLALPAGTYSVTASGSSAGVRSTVVTIGQDNVGWDVQYSNTPIADQPVPGDYDGDGKSDIAVYHPATAQWFINYSATGPKALQFGQANVDIPVPGDYDGDGKTDLAVYRPTTGQWLIQGSATGAKVVSFGTPGLDNPVPGDYDGDGKTDPATYRPSQGVWYVQQSTAGPRGIALGQANLDVPVPADYDGDGKTDFAVYQPTTGLWFVIGSNSVGNIVKLGQPSIDVPVPGDYDGDHKADFAVYRTTTSDWLIVGTNSAGRITHLGQAGDVAVPADYTGDTKLDLSVFRPSSATWYAIKSAGSVAIKQFGQPGLGKTVTALSATNIINYGVTAPKYVGAAAAKTASGVKHAKPARHAVHPKAGHPVETAKPVTSPVLIASVTSNSGRRT